jgi:lysophospholipase L1-like esterase
MEEKKQPIIAFLGDSITAGCGASDDKHGFCARLEEMTGFTIENYGAGGTRIARQRIPTPGFPEFDQDFIIRSNSLDPHADVVFVFGGTNDFGHGDAPLGKKGDRDPYTFYGALVLLCENLLKHYRPEQLVFVLPLPRFGEDSIHGDGGKKAISAPLSAYRTAILEVVEPSGIFVLDLAGIFPLPQDNKGDEYTADGLHPNDRGHDLLAQIFTCYLWDHYHYEPRCFPKENPLK